MEKFSAHGLFLQDLDGQIKWFRINGCRLFQWIGCVFNGLDEGSYGIRIIGSLKDLELFSEDLDISFLLV